MTTTFPPAPYTQPYLTRLESTWHGISWMIGSAATDIEPMTEDPDTTWKTLEPLLEQIEDGRHAFFGRVARVEFIWDESLDITTHNMRGAVLFDASGAVIVHVANALLGYWGHGPTLSWNILSALGVPEELFRDVQRITKDSRPYVVVFSREKPSEPEGTDELIVTHDEPLLEAWQGWRAK